MKLVDDLEIIWKRWSVRLVAAQVALIATWAGFSAIGWTPDVPDWLKWTVVILFGAAAVTAANFKQKNLGE